MDALNWEHRPSLRRPIVVAAFAGWNDAGEAATGTVRYLATQWHARAFASIEPEDFYDFSETRPTVRIVDGITRAVEWPSNRFTAAHLKGSETDVIFIHGTEPQLKWKTFCSTVLDVAREVDASMVVTLGGLLADVPHTRPSHVTCSASNADLTDALGLPSSEYEGPTGIVGALHHAVATAGIPSVSFWVTVPHYVSQTPSPKATLALVEHTATLLGVPVSTVDLEIAAASYEQQVSDLVDSDDDMAHYVLQLEESEDDDFIEPDILAAEAERFLRDQSE